MPLIEIQNSRVRYVVMGAFVTLMVFAGYLVFSKDTVVGAAVGAIVTGVLFTTVVAWIERHQRKNE